MREMIAESAVEIDGGKVEDFAQVDRTTLPR
jgi:hypothetical protein